MADLTIMPAGGRGCGSRKDGGVYGCVAMSPYGTPLKDFMLDPPVPFLNGQPFQGMHPAPEYITAGWNTDEHLILMDWVGENGYKTVPDFVEEVRRYGMSRRIPTTFDWESIGGRQVWLALIHAKAAPEIEGLPDSFLEYIWCPWRPAVTPPPGYEKHWPGCLYHNWPLAYQEHGVSPEESAWLKMPWGNYCPLDMVQRHSRTFGHKSDEDVLAIPALLPEATYPHPAFFAVLPLTHLEAVQYVEVEVAEKVDKAGIDLYVVEE